MSTEIMKTATRNQRNEGFASGKAAFDPDGMVGIDLVYPRIKIPSEGKTVFEKVSEGVTMERADELVGVIIHSHPAYTYYRGSYAGAGNPPDCVSYDGKIGIGIPGGSCRTCQYNQFGSGGGRSKACKNKQQLYILREGEYVPEILTIPTGSLRSLSLYYTEQLNLGRNLSSIVTRLSLTAEVTKNGNTFSRVVFRFERNLSSEETEVLEPVIRQTREYAAGLTVSSMAREEDMMINPDTGEVIVPLS